MCDILIYVNDGYETDTYHRYYLFAFITIIKLAGFVILTAL